VSKRNDLPSEEEIKKREQKQYELALRRRQEILGEPIDACEKITEEEFDY